jgi:hypothetical protein
MCLMLPLSLAYKIITSDEHVVKDMALQLEIYVQVASVPGFILKLDGKILRINPS